MQNLVRNPFLEYLMQNLAPFGHFFFFDVFNSYSQLFNLEIPLTPHFSSKIFLIFFKPASLIKEVIVINCNPLPKTLISVSDKTLLLRSGFPIGFKNMRWGEMTERI